MLSSLVSALVAAAMSAAGAAPAEPVKRPLVSDAGVKAAQRFAKEREGLVSFAVIGTNGRVRGYDRDRTYPSASVAKAMLLVELLRRARDRELTAYERSKLEPMILMSKNPPARQLFSLVGSPGLYAVAEAAGMKDFSSDFSLFESQITATDQARFFLRVDKLMPERHRAYGRRLLRNVIPEHSWGIPSVAEPLGFTAFHKGGWRSDVVHQVALLEKSPRRRIAVAVLTATTDQGYGRATIKGVARRVLSDLDPPRDRARGERLGPRRRAQ